MRLGRQGIDRETRETFQPRLWLTVIGLVLIGAYIVAFIAENNKKVTVHFVLFSAHTSVIWVILLTLTIGVVGGLLLSQLVRRRSRQQRG
jgi:uncharacterized integral membrane protein